MTVKRQARTEAKATGAQSSALRELAKDAKAINAKLAAADKAQQAANINQEKADDARLEAAVAIGAARAKCRESKIPFEAWCGDHLSISCAEATRLAKIGEAEDPKAALAAHRRRNAEKTAEHRAKKAARSRGAQGAIRDKAADAAPKVSPIQHVQEAIDALPKDVQANAARSVAEKAGMVAVDKESATARALGKPMADLATVKAAALALSFGDKRRLLHALVMDLGATVVNVPDDPDAAKYATGDDGLDVPPALDRRGVQGKSRAKRKTTSKRASA